MWAVFADTDVFNINFYTDHTDKDALKSFRDVRILSMHIHILSREQREQTEHHLILAKG